MRKAIFVGIIVLILVCGLAILFIYDKNAISEENAQRQSNNQADTENEELQAEGENEESEEEEELGTLIIKKIELKGTVKEGSTSEILKNYIGHIEETDKFDGNIGLAAHNRGNEYSYFARINELELGDEILYKSKFGERKYIVHLKKRNIRNGLDITRTYKRKQTNINYMYKK